MSKYCYLYIASIVRRYICTDADHAAGVRKGGERSVIGMLQTTLCHTNIYMEFKHFRSTITKLSKLVSSIG